MTTRVMLTAMVSGVLVVVGACGLAVLWAGVSGVVGEIVSARHHARLHRLGQDCGACATGSSRRL